MICKKISLSVFSFVLLASGAARAEMAIPAQDGAVINSLLATVQNASIDLPTDAPLSLKNALMEAYRNSPDIQAARAELRAVDETHPQAMAGYRPALTGEADYELQNQDGNITSTHGEQKSLSLVLTQPIYSGGSTVADTAAADSKIRAQRALLSLTEQQTLLRAATSYMDVVRDQEVVLLTINNETALATQLRAARERFRLGDITLTDIKQSENRLADAIASRLSAQASLKKSKADFESVVWIKPNNVQAPDGDIVTPGSLKDALAEAEKSNPNNIFTKDAIAEANANTHSLTGTKRPQVDLTGQVNRTYDPIDFQDDQITSSAVILRLTMPFYSGGRTDSLIRQSRETESQRRIERYRTGRSVRQSVIEAWENLKAAEAEVDARRIQVNAAKTARDGVKSEADYGTRTTLDVLDAEHEYLTAQINYAVTEHDRIVAAYQLVSAMGDLTPGYLGLETPAYDPVRHFDKVKNAWYGTRISEIH